MTKDFTNRRISKIKITCKIPEKLALNLIKMKTIKNYHPAKISYPTLLIIFLAKLFCKSLMDRFLAIDQTLVFLMLAANLPKLKVIINCKL